MIISTVGLSMFVINATCNGCRLEAFNFGALNVVFNTWVFLGFFTYEMWAEFKKSCGNTEFELKKRNKRGTMHIRNRDATPF